LPLDPSRLIALCALVIIHTLQADTAQGLLPLLVGWQRSTPLPTVAAWLMPYAASLTHSYLSCARYICMIITTRISNYQLNV